MYLKGSQFGIKQGFGSVGVGIEQEVDPLGLRIVRILDQLLERKINYG